MSVSPTWPADLAVLLVVWPLLFAVIVTATNQVERWLQGGTLSWRDRPSDPSAPSAPDGVADGPGRPSRPPAGRPAHGR